ncbi:hypothetical protein GTW68_29480 [Streptomyces sp. SID4945]|nr:hypothetical protein [Streptomyces sp. SID4945]
MGAAGARLEDGHRPLVRTLRFHRSPQLNAAPADQVRLLDLQALDTRLGQLAHRKESLPEHAELTGLGKDATGLRDLLVAARTEEGDTAREQTKAEQDVDQVRTRATRDQQRLDSGAVTSPKDLENLQREIASLAKRQGDLEDVVLEIMERRESAQSRVAELTERLGSVETRVAEVTERRDAAASEIDAETATVAKERAVVAGSVPDSLLALYEKLRAQRGGVGAARLYQRRCEGCQLELNITEANEVKAAKPDAVVRCENCGRILVRTSESGL